MNKELQISKIVGEYEGELAMLKKASVEMIKNIPTNEAGETSADALLKINEWVARMEKQALETMVSKIKEVD